MEEESRKAASVLANACEKKTVNCHLDHCFQHQSLLNLTLFPWAGTLLRGRDWWRGEVNVGGFSSHVTCNRQTGDCNTVGKCEIRRTSHCIFFFFFWSLPRMRAAISLLFWDGMSLTVSSAVRPFWSKMFTSIPGE